MTATCRTCSAAIVWVTSDKTGKKMPMDAEPLDTSGPGAFAVVREVAYAPSVAIEQTALAQAVSTARATEILNEAGAWHTSHFATCPTADQHRRLGT